MMAEGDDIGSSGKPVALEARQTGEDGRRFSPSTARNKDAVAKAFSDTMPVSGHILEIASGTGEHGAHLVSLLAGLRWTYSDIDELSRASQAAWVRYDDFGGRLTGPVRIDASLPHWDEAEPSGPFDGMFCANMIHIAPFEAAEGLLRGAGRLLGSSGNLFLYGPFSRSGEIADSNASFSDDLKRRDPSWGVRDLDLELVPIAADAGLELDQVIPMPANNLSVVFRRL